MNEVRLNPLDTAWLFTESRATPNHVGGLLQFRLPADAPRDFVGRLMADFRAHRHFVAPWNRRLKFNFTKNPVPAWVEEADDAIDLEYHVRHAALPWPGGERELGELIGRLHSTPLDLARPPWECTLIEGLEGDRFAMYVKMHHALIDGVSGMKMLERAMAPDPARSLKLPPFWATGLGGAARPRSGGGGSGLAPTVANATAAAIAGLSLQGRSLPQLAAAFGQIVRRIGDPAEGPAVPFDAPHSALNGRVREKRRFATQQFELARLRALAEAADATLNDVVLAICGGALRRYLAAHDELPAHSLYALTPAPAADPSAAQRPWRRVSLATDVEDPVRRLRAIRAQSAGDTAGGGSTVLARTAKVVARALAGEPAAAWLHTCPADAWAAQLRLLLTRLDEDAATRARRWPLLGVPFAVKDNIDIAGQPTTAACPAFGFEAAASATVVQRLLDAGALWLGKTNLDQFATGLVGTRSPHGRPACVADATRISGGSSSGSAVAVAAGVVPFALGTDTAGSGRVPAAFNGLVGLKPTPGRVSTAGVLPACRSLDCVSVFAHTVDDAARVLAVIEGPDAADPYSAFEPGPAVLPAPARIGIPAAPELDAALGYDQAWQTTLQRLRDAGHELVPLDFGPLHEVAALLYEGPWVAERHAVVQGLLATQPDAFDPTVRRVIGRALDFSATDAFRGAYRLRELAAEVATLWQRVDQLLVPSTPTHPTFDEVDADPLGTNARLGTYTNFVNLLGWCALALPAVRTPGGLPFGVTAIAPGGFDVALPYSEDWDLWLKLSRDYPFVKLDRVSTLYRQHPYQGNRVLRPVDYRTRLLEDAAGRWGLASADGRAVPRSVFRQRLARYHLQFALHHLQHRSRRVALRSLMRAWRLQPGWLRPPAVAAAALLGWRPRT